MSKRTWSRSKAFRGLTMISLATQNSQLLENEALAIASSRTKDAVVTLKDLVYEMDLPIIWGVLQFQGRDEVSRD